jgi:ribosome recycling factor
MTTIAEITEDHGRQDGPVHRAFKNNLTKIRTGRANPALLDTVHVDYYGAMLPISQVGQRFAARCAHDQRPALGKGHGRQDREGHPRERPGAQSRLDGRPDPVPMPPMSEERRKEMTKLVRHEGETAKIAVRNLRPRRQRCREEAGQGQARVRGRTQAHRKPKSRSSPTATSRPSINWSPEKSKK